MGPIRARLRHWKAVLWRPFLAFLGVPWAVLSIYSLIRSEFFPAFNHPAIDWVPKWSAATWAVLGLAILLLVTLEGSYRLVGRWLDQQEILKTLTALREYGILLLNERVTEQSLKEWEGSVEKWRLTIREWLERGGYSVPARSHVDMIGTYHGRGFAHAINPEHSKALDILAERLERLERLLGMK